MKLRRRREESLDNEIHDYIERETQDNMAAGMTADEARHAALRKFGPVLNMKEETRTVWGWVWFERLAQDLRHGYRMLVKNPGFTAVAVISIAIGVGANCASFSFADALLLRPLTVLHPSEVVTVGAPESVAGFSSLLASYRDYVDFRDQSKSFEGLVAFNETTFGLAVGRDSLPQMKYGSMVTGNFFRVLGVEPELGRAFRSDEDQVPGRDAVVVLGHDLWERDFAGDRSVLGRRVRINGIEFTVIGVAPARFRGMNQFLQTGFYVPIMMWPQLTNNAKDNPLEARGNRSLTIKGRLKSGVAMAQAQAELAAIARNLERLSGYQSESRRCRAHRAGVQDPAVATGCAVGCYDQRSLVGGAAGGLRQCRGLAHQPGSRPRTGNRFAAGYWGRAPQADPSVAHRKFAARCCGRHRRFGAWVCRHPVFP